MLFEYSSFCIESRVDSVQNNNFWRSDLVKMYQFLKWNQSKVLNHIFKKSIYVDL